MTKVEWYVFRSALFASIVCLLSLAGMIWVSQAVQQLDLVTGKGQTVFLFLNATALLLPSMIMIVTPIAVFVGCIYTLNKLGGDSELIVMSAAGMTPFQLARPYILLALIATAFCLFLTNAAMPNSALALRSIVTQVKADVITRVVEEGRFVELEAGIVFHYRSKGPGGTLLGVMFQDRRDPTKAYTTYLAERGAIADLDDGKYLLLERGSLQRQSPTASESAVIAFDRYAVDLDQLSPKADKVIVRPRERSTYVLLTTDYQKTDMMASPARLYAELNERFAGPLLALAAAAIAFAALGAPRTTRQGRGVAIMFAVLALVMMRSLMFGASTQAARGTPGIWMLYSIPLIAIIASLWMVHRQFSAKNPDATVQFGIKTTRVA